ncbi:tRNA threonylcarbamoyladenosine dehydratase [Luoshenia tenuis]|nr:tRNA threonylcarbamoyladenosine dehydratase [Luoshenia tenuis]
MENQLEKSRTAMLIGGEGIAALARARVLLIGLGGVGGHAAEALLRAGVGHLTVMDGDSVSLSNLNRQLVATQRTLGQNKALAMEQRLRQIFPDADITALAQNYTPDNGAEILSRGFDYVADAVDDVRAKLDLARRCSEMGIRLVASMGAGNRLDPTAFRVGDIFKTTGDPLARKIRRELREMGIKKLKVVYSTELPHKPDLSFRPEQDAAAHPPGSIAFVPAAAGLALAGAVVNDLLSAVNKKEGA